MEVKASKAPEIPPSPPRSSQGPYTLAIDIGGSFLKAAVLDAAGNMLADRVRTATPHPAPPERVLRELEKIVGSLSAYDRISVGFPGFVRDGRIFTAPNLGTELWHRFPLAATLKSKLGKPTRVLNDADVQGLGVVGQKGYEIVVTLGTGFGTAFFKDGRLLPHLELSQHPIRKDMTYDQYMGATALEQVGGHKWNKRLQRVIDMLRTLTNFEILHLGGGNTKHIKIELPSDVKISQNIAGITGGIRLWDDHMTDFFKDEDSAPEPAAKPSTKSRHAR